MAAIRTDLALERAAGAPSLSGVRQRTRGHLFAVTEIEIESDASGAPIGKPKGRYVTLEADHLGRSHAHYPQLVEELAEELGRFLPAEGCVFVAGLGNREITPDALGPRVVSRVLATRHLSRVLTEEERQELPSLRPVCTLAGGVLGETGIESAEMLSALCQKIQPAALVAIDALACANLDRLGTTIQMCDSGISPGSGVANHRRELSYHTLGVPVVAVGVPTVVDLHTAVQGVYGRSVPADAPNMMVTPRDIDRLIDHAGAMLGCALNMALHPGLSFAQAEGL